MLNIKLIKILFVFSFLFCTKQSNAQIQFDWANNIGGGLTESGRDIVLDNNGNVYTTGYTKSGTFLSDEGNPYTNNGDMDVYISKSDPDGNLIWLKGFGGSGEERGRHIYTDNNDNVIVLGTFDSATDFDPGADEYLLNPNGNRDSFLIQLDSSGNFNWVKHFDSDIDIVLTDIAFDSENNLLITGRYEGNPDFNPEPETFYLASNDQTNLALIKLNSNGDFIWAKNILVNVLAADIDLNTRIVHNIITDENDNIFTTGHFTGTVDFDPGPDESIISSEGGEDIFISKMDASGNLIWVKTMGAAYFDNSYSIHLDNEGNIYSVGTFGIETDLDPGPEVYDLPDNDTFSADSDIYMLKLSPQGDFIWAKKINTSHIPNLYDVTIDNEKNIYIAGNYEFLADFNPLENESFILDDSDNSNYDYFVAKYNIDAEFLWVKEFNARPWAITADENQNVFTTGVAGNYDLDPGEGEYFLDTYSNSDIFIHKMVPCEASYGPTTSISVCEGYTFNEVFLTQNGVYSRSEANANGCDSIITIDLTVNNTFATEYVATCDSYTWPLDGNTYTNSTIATYNLGIENQNGCDSIAVLDLTINNTGGLYNINTCNSYTWDVNDVTYTESGFYYHNSINEYGCADEQTLLLVINNSLPSETEVSACGSYTWDVNDTNYTESGTYSHTTLLPWADCEFTLTLHLTIDEGSVGEEDITACDSFLWPANNTTYTESGTYTTLLNNANGCDSLATLNLSINDSGSTEESITACNSYLWTTNETSYDQSGTYTHNSTNANGCETTNVLHLTINNANTGEEQITTCEFFTWPANEINYTQSGLYTTILSNALECDSTVTLDLTILPITNGTESITSCDAFLWSANDTNYTESGTYTSALINANGCDSIATLELTIHNSSSGTESIIACNNYLWSANSIEYTESGEYTAIITNSNGCDSLATLQLTINNVNTSLTTDSPPLIIANASDASYQWLDCDKDFEVIDGATEQSYTVTQNGTYAVSITQNECTEISECFTINNIGIEEILGNNIGLYPNPTHDIINIISDGIQLQQIAIYDTTGKHLRTITERNISYISMKELEAGIYFLELTFESTSYIKKVIKQ